MIPEEQAIREIYARCAECGREYPLTELYCNLSGRGANSLCADHDYSDLYCEHCVMDHGRKKLKEILLLNEPQRWAILDEAGVIAQGTENEMWDIWDDPDQIYMKQQVVGKLRLVEIHGVIEG